MSPHLHMYPTGTYTYVKDVTYDAGTGTEMIVRSAWEPNSPGTVVAIASRAVVSGFGKWKASVTGTHKGNSLSASTSWATFGSTGTFGPIPTWRNVQNLVCLAGVTWALDNTLTAQPKALSGSGSVDMKQ